MIPFLSNMALKKNVMIFSDSSCLYQIVLRPRYGMIVCYGNCLLSDESWPIRFESEEYRTIQGMRRLQRTKINDMRVFNELKQIQKLAIKHKIPESNILFIDCGNSFLTCDEVSNLAKEALERKIEFNKIRCNSLWPGFVNKSGLEMTDCFLDDVWPVTRNVDLI